MNSPSYSLRKPSRWPRRNWQWPGNKPRSPSRKRRCRAAGFIGDACNQAHDVAPAPASGSADQRLTLDG
jgi:hypothetical protein